MLKALSRKGRRSAAGRRQSHGRPQVPSVLPPAPGPPEEALVATAAKHMGLGPRDQARRHSVRYRRAMFGDFRDSARYGRAVAAARWTRDPLRSGRTIVDLLSRGMKRLSLFPHFGEPSTAWTRSRASTAPAAVWISFLRYSGTLWSPSSTGAGTSRRSSPGSPADRRVVRDLRPQQPRGNAGREPRRVQLPPPRVAVVG